MVKISKNTENDIPNHPFHSNKKSKNNKNDVGCDPTQLTKLCLHAMQTQKKTKKKYGKQKSN